MTKRSWENEVREALGAAGRIVVLGVGNPDKADDGAGICAAAAVRKRLSPTRKRYVRVLLGGPSPENLTGKIRAFRPGLVLILDAALGGRNPGALFLVAPEKIADDGVTTHQISLHQLVSYIEESIGCPVIVLGIQPKSLEYEGKMSAAAARGISNAVEFLLKSLGKPGQHSRPRGDGCSPVKSSSA
jgi:hydrogenase maturation protease